MPINRDYLGRTYPAGAPYEVAREKIRDFADAIGDQNPAYRDPAAARKLGHPDVVAPPTFPIVLSMRLAGMAVFDPDLGVDYSMVVHGEQRFTYRRPIVAGDVLTGTVTIVDIAAKGRNEMLTTRTDLVDRRRRAGLLVVLHAGRPRRGREGGRVMAATVNYDDVRVGTEVPAQAFPLQRINLVMYCGASGDFNVIHWNERIAKGVGLPDVIAHGMLTMAEAVRVVTDWCGDPGAVVDYGVRFSSMVVVPDDGAGATVRVGGVVEELLPDRQVRVGLTATSADAKVLTQAKAVVQLA